MSYPLGKISFRNAAIKILVEKKEPMKAKAILLEALKRNLIKTRGKTPVNTLTAQLNELTKSGGAYKEFKMSKIKEGNFYAVKST